MMWIFESGLRVVSGIREVVEGFELLEEGGGRKLKDCKTWGSESLVSSVRCAGSG